MASWLVSSTPDRVIRALALARDIVLCSEAKQFPLVGTLSTEMYKWVPPGLMPGIILR